MSCDDFGTWSFFHETTRIPIDSYAVRSVQNCTIEYLKNRIFTNIRIKYSNIKIFEKEFLFHITGNHGQFILNEEKFFLNI